MKYTTQAARSSQRAAWAFLAPVTVYLLACYGYPLYTNLDPSLRDYTVYSFVHGGAPFSGFANYTAVFRDPSFGPALEHTLEFTAASLAFQYSIGLALAVFFRRHF